MLISFTFQTNHRYYSIFNKLKQKQNQKTADDT